MNLFKLLLIILAVIMTSCYFFPFVIAAFPMVNSKMILAVVGLIMLAINLVKKSNASINKDFLFLSLWALGISLVSYASMMINNTPDDTFVTYFMSMWVWLGGAYAFIMFIKYVHEGVSVPLVVNYLLAVCMVQCVIAIIFDSFPEAAEWHENTFAGEGFMGNTEEDRLHGIGCSLDVAGFRFAAVICMVTILMSNNVSYFSKWSDGIYLFSICFMSIIGNMISRSTVIGSVMALITIFCMGIFVRGRTKLIAELGFIIAIAVAVCIYLYNTNTTFKSNIRFGFEGFFSIAEKGEWQTNSNNILKNMVVWPDNYKTWIIGDGYINNPDDKSQDTFDPYYVGEHFGGFYMGTDIGYLRYIFYFGVIGLAVFSMFFIQVCKVLCIRFPNFRWMFFMMLVVNFIQWCKVSTDLFVVFAPFLCISAEENKEVIKKNMLGS